MMKLTTVEFKHGYFGRQADTPLSVSPSDSSIRVMTGHGLWWKERPGGFFLMYDSRHAGSDRTREAVLREGVVLRFLLRLKDPYFFNYTEGPSPVAGRNIYYFHNRPDSASLQADPQVSGSDLFDTVPDGMPVRRQYPLGSLAGRPFDQPFAILRLRLRPWMTANYSVEFGARSSKWHYILVGRHLQDLQSPAIIVNSSVPKDTFVGPNNITLTDGRPALSFVSRNPIALSEWPGAMCMLVEGWDGGTGKYKMVMPALPVPDVRVISRAVAAGSGGPADAGGSGGPADAGGAENYSEIFIY
jgi:hypothetical protein